MYRPCPPTPAASMPQSFSLMLPRHARLPIPPSAITGEPVHSRDGLALRLRSIEPDDVQALIRCFERLSPGDVRRRFHHALSELPLPMAQRLCRIDPAGETALVLMDHAVKPAEMRGVGRLYVDLASDSAEFSVLVESAWARRGLGALLMRRLVQAARARGLAEIWGYVLMENRPMLELCRELGFQRRAMAGEPGTALIALDLRTPGVQTARH